MKVPAGGGLEVCRPNPRVETLTMQTSDHNPPVFIRARINTFRRGSRGFMDTEPKACAASADMRYV